MVENISILIEMSKKTTLLIDFNIKMIKITLFKISNSFLKFYL